MSRKKLPYEEGSWFAVPLRDGGFALGVAARIDGGGGILGYFFGPRVDDLGDLKHAPRPKPDQAILIAQFGDLGLLKGDWSVLERDSSWDRSQWPMPRFARLVEDLGVAWLSEYDEDTLEWISEERIDPSEVNKYPYDTMMGYGALEITLTKLLGESSRSVLRP